MERNISTRIIVLLSIFVGLMPMVAWCQDNNETSTRTKLKIAIPVREFKEFVDIQRNPETGEITYSGFAIEVFYEVMNKTLPSPIPFEFVPFQKPDGTMNGSFDNMLQAVFNKTYDGAVGEITILHHRMAWVDFTMPYIGSPITMLVRVNKEQPTSSNTSGISLIKITYAFLITTYALSFIATTIYVVGIITKSSKCARLFGRNDNNEPKDARLGALIHTRLLMTTFFLIIMILLASYIVSQASSMTPQLGSATIKSLNQLFREDANVGYREGSFIYNLLRIKGFPDSKLISLKSDEQMVEMLSKGGVDAIVANEPHLKLLHAKLLCDNNFTIVPIPYLHAAGIGFAFKKGSDIVKDVSRGIMKLADNGHLQEIENRTLWKLKACGNGDLNNDQYVASSSLPNDYIWILIVGGVLIGLLTIVSFFFLF